MSGVRVLVGTHKGAFVLTSDGKRDRWEVSGPHFAGWDIYHVKGSLADPDRLYASQTSGWSGQVIQRSDDGGDHFRRMPDPGLPNRVTMSFPCRVMQFAAHPRKPGDIYATLEVNGAMHSRDGGESWEDCAQDLQRLAQEPRLKQQQAQPGKRDARGAPEPRHRIGALLPDD